ncbi:hypothetical protein BCR34DRAFT_580927 [Clohesyomyces aquaticus]|uniref:C2H2-type domain-containing protein n=1 Tax=Clohesyomyces aquaticus TaxID=1231657 RepID=A0A1Y1Y521_9PLEO|nr:hypothetical protein BCR34DRAFT_580927 [Clohesyomyces aquaticus]
MPPKYKGATNALRTFKCDLCVKSYARQTELEAHFSSYDHTHRARMADMKKINASMDSGNVKRKRPEADGEMVTLDPTAREKGGDMPKFKRVGKLDGEVKTMPGFKRVKTQEELEREKEGQGNTEKEKDVDMKNPLDDVPALDKHEDSDADTDDDDTDIWSYSFMRPQKCDCGCGFEWKIPTSEQLALPLDQPLNL